MDPVRGDGDANSQRTGHSQARSATTSERVSFHDGVIVREVELATCPETLARCLGEIAPTFELIGLEAAPMSEWLVRGLGSRPS
jgi:hypothetical protein